MGNGAGLRIRGSAGALAAVVGALVACSSGVGDLRFQKVGFAGDAAVSGGAGGDASVGNGGSSGGGSGTGGIGPGGSGAVAGTGASGGTGAGTGTGATGGASGGSGGATGGAGGVQTSGGTGGGFEGGTFSLAEVPITTFAPGQQLDNITWATWEPNSQSYFLLETGTNQQVWQMTTAGTVAAPITLPSGTIAKYAIAASPNTIFVIINNQLHRLDFQGTENRTALSVPAVNASYWSLAYGSGYLMLANREAPLSVLADADDAFREIGGDAGAASVQSAVSDGLRFAIKVGTESALHVLEAPAFAFSSSPCVTADTSYKAIPALKGDAIALASAPIFSNTSVRLYFYDWPTGMCSTDYIDFTPQIPQYTVGLITDNYALVIEDVVATAPSYALTIGVRDRYSMSALTTLRSVSTAALPANPYFVMGSDRTALLVTGRAPILLSY